MTKRIMMEAHKHFVKNNMFYEARRILHVLNNRSHYICLGINDTDWNISEYFESLNLKCGFSGYVFNRCPTQNYRIDYSVA